MLAHRLAMLAQEAAPTANSDKENLYPHLSELIVGLLAFAVIFFVLWKWALPRMREVLDERRRQIQGQLETAEQTRQQADQELSDYRAQLANAREEGNRIIEEARVTADQLRRDIQANAEREAQSTVERAQEEIRAERDRVFSELRTQVSELAVDIAGRVVGKELNQQAHEQLIDDYIDQVAAGETGQN